MGTDLGRVDFGDKYKFKPKDGPAPGQYDADVSPTRKGTKSAIIRDYLHPEKRPVDTGPDPG